MSREAWFRLGDRGTFHKHFFATDLESHSEEEYNRIHSNAHLLWIIFEG